MMEEEDELEENGGSGNEEEHLIVNETETNNGRRVFDTNIPTTHEYLGKLDNISGYTVYEEGQIIELPAMFTNTLAFPGFTLPLVISNSDQDFHSGFVLIWLFDDKEMFFEYGVIMEVYERSVERGQINIKARGRQRCFILPQQISMDARPQICKAKVKIMEEPPITSPISCTQLDALRQRFPYRQNYNSKDARRTNRHRKWHLGQFYFPHWVYDLYEVEYYVDKIVTILSKYYAQENIPKDPTLLSFWFGQNFQLMINERLRILECNTTLERLQNALKYLNLERIICCFHCDTIVSHQKDVFAMSKDGLQSNYVNPGGVVYETVTVKKISNFRLDGLPCKEFSWFPGYAWTIIKCSVCSGHLGWMFTARNLQPSKFYGLARSCLAITTNPSSSDEDDVDD